MLIAIAREMGFSRMAEEMQRDMEMEMSGEILPYLKKFAA
jgi:hypothetical protein